MNSSTTRLRGLIAAPFTPFYPDLSVDISRIAVQVEHLIAQGVSGAFVCGTTGEGLSLTVKERMEITERWTEVAQDRLSIIVHVGHPSLHDAQLLARHAAQHGATATAAMPTSCLRPGSVADLVDYAAALAKGAPDLPFYYYHIPSASGVSFKMVDFLQEAGRTIPNLAGCKFTSEDLFDFGLAGDLDGGRFDMLFGRDEIMLAGASIGARGFVGSTYNLMAPLYLRLLEALARRDLAAAQKLQAISRDLIHVMIDAGGLPAIKAAMSLIGMDLGPMRLPLRTLSPLETARLSERLETSGLFRFAVRAEAEAAA